MYPMNQETQPVPAFTWKEGKILSFGPVFLSLQLLK